jgi:hypothetical protein
LISDSLTWSSDIEGGLGSGSPLVFQFRHVGMHVITLTAADSDGAEGTASINLTAQ